ncbi:UrcA family protein [Sphingomonas solaris]|uniref:UrcA family protein n=1 Tax=Alterirhizorhabdus solaris TaxID=2529389 RepID=A0A558RBV6_9SPHN|nr:UrcA family protein [Sphingomonas solaris]TVV76818.1 UrcA family protein [Sphingomonas solaris]
MKIAIAALAAVTLGSAAFAGTVANPFAKDSATLTLKGLDLASADGQQRLAVRVDQAARAVCGENLANIHIDLEARARACRADVAEQVRGQIEARVAAASPARSVQLASVR